MLMLIEDDLLSCLWSMLGEELSNKIYVVVKYNVKKELSHYEQLFLHVIERNHSLWDLEDLEQENDPLTIVIN